MVLIAICTPCKSPWTKNNKNPIQLYLLPIWTPFTWISDCILAPKKTTKWLKNSNREIHFIEDLSFRDYNYFFWGGGGCEALCLSTTILSIDKRYNSPFQHANRALGMVACQNVDTNPIMYVQFWKLTIL